MNMTEQLEDMYESILRDSGRWKVLVRIPDQDQASDQTEDANGVVRSLNRLKEQDHLHLASNPIFEQHRQIRRAG